MTPDVTTTPEALLLRVALSQRRHGHPDCDSCLTDEALPILAASPALRDAIALGVAWAAVEAVLPDGWMLQCGMTVWPDADRRYAAVSHKRDWRPVGFTDGNVDIHRDDYVDANGPTKEAALLALHAALLAREEGSR